MNIRTPEVSRKLAKLIQPLSHGARESFIDDARSARNMDEFMKFYPGYERLVKPE